MPVTGRNRRRSCRAVRSSAHERTELRSSVSNGGRNCLTSSSMAPSYLGNAPHAAASPASCVGSSRPDFASTNAGEGGPAPPEQSLRGPAHRSRSVHTDRRDPTCRDAYIMCLRSTSGSDDVTFFAHISKRWPRSGSMELPSTNEADHRRRHHGRRYTGADRGAANRRSEVKRACG
jgi:hypothetical protein